MDTGTFARGHGKKVIAGAKAKAKGKKDGKATELEGRGTGEEGMAVGMVGK